eukprot:tig00001154_g7286.t1
MQGFVFVLVTSLAWLALLSLARRVVPPNSRRFSIHFPWHISWTTSRFNTLIWNIGRRRKAQLMLWYRAGTPLAVSCMLIGMYLLFRNASDWLRGGPSGADGGQRSPGVALVPLIPGLTMPLSHLVYLWGALLFSAGVHEAGHALCAAAHGVRTTEAGAYVSFMAPLAFVRLDGVDSQHVAAQVPPSPRPAPPRPRHPSAAPAAPDRSAAAAHLLRRLVSQHCDGAGAWLGVLLLPLLLWPLYAAAGPGPVVLGVDPASALGPHLRPGDLLTGLNDCPVASLDDWRACILHAAAAAPSFCLPPASLAAAASRGGDCCGAGYDGPLQCFRALSPPPASGRAGAGHGRALLAAAPTGLCLRGPSFARATLRRRRRHPRPVPQRRCRRGSCSPCSPCCRAAGPAETPPATRRAEGRPRRPLRVAFAGSPAQLLAAVDAAHRVARLGLLAAFDLPGHLERLLRYLFSVSLALAVLNMVPCPGLDGAPVAKLLAEMLALHAPLALFAPASSARALIDLGANLDGPVAVSPLARAASRACNAFGAALLLLNALAVFFARR